MSDQNNPEENGSKKTGTNFSNLTLGLVLTLLAIAWFFAGIFYVAFIYNG